MYYSGPVRICMETKDDWKGVTTLAAVVIEGVHDYIEHVIEYPTIEGLEDVVDILTSKKFDMITLGNSHLAREHFRDRLKECGLGPAFIGVA